MEKKETKLAPVKLYTTKGFLAFQDGHMIPMQVHIRVTMDDYITMSFADEQEEVMITADITKVLQDLKEQTERGET